MERLSVVLKISNDWQKKDLNGRQIKNAVAGAHALAMHKKTKVLMSDLELVICMNEEFMSDFDGPGHTSNKHSYL
ncbi:hypothetical protein N7G274_009957 [Stereocaulon virgatum]|uniref:Uncharacterized protein n=1 Tax=Stereocaulon virgatum TaxID=373712 RepID=A0ABR4A1S1_9LECA